jgi:hypothetical protein
MVPKQENYHLARRLAVENLRRSDLCVRAACGGAAYRREPEGKERIEIGYLGEDFSLIFPEGTVAAGSGSPLSLREEIFLLHYLEKASGIPLKGEWISFAEIPGGAFYHPVFAQRCQAAMARTFGPNPEEIRALAGEWGGEPLGLGDEAVRLPVLPRLPLAIVLWRGDTEFPAEGKILFDASAGGYLPVEDIVVLAETVVGKLIKKKNDSPQRAQSPQRKEL